MAWQFIIPAVASLLGQAGRGQASGRESQNNAINAANRNQIDLYGTQQGSQTSLANAQQNALMQALMSQSGEQISQGNLDLNRRQFALQAPDARGRTALLGSLLQNLQPAQLSGLSPKLAARTPQITGGLTPAALGPLARQAGLLMQQGAVKGLQQGDQFAPLQKTDFQSGVLNPNRALMQPPALQQLKNPGMLEQILSGGGLLGSILGILMQNTAKKTYAGEDI